MALLLQVTATVTDIRMVEHLALGMATVAQRATMAAMGTSSPLVLRQFLLTRVSSLALRRMHPN
jgi:hypothetical protein